MSAEPAPADEVPLASLVWDAQPTDATVVALVREVVEASFARELGGTGEPRSGPIGAVVARVVHAGGVTVDI